MNLRTTLSVLLLGGLFTITHSFSSSEDEFNFETRYPHSQLGLDSADTSSYHDSYSKLALNTLSDPEMLEVEPNKGRNSHTRPHLNQPRDSKPTPIHCVDENNRPADWVVFYKLPRVHNSPNPLIVNGEAYMTVSSEDLKQNGKRVEERRDASVQAAPQVVEKEATGNVKRGEPEAHDSGSADENLERQARKYQNKSDAVKPKAQNSANVPEVRSKLRVDGEKLKVEESEQTKAPREHFPYYSYTTDDVTQDEQKHLMDTLKVVLMKQFVKDAREQIHLERDAEKTRGDKEANEREEKVEEQAQLLRSELAGGRKRWRRNIVGKDRRNLGWDFAWNKVMDKYPTFNRYDKDAGGNGWKSTESPHLEVDFSDSLRILNNLLRARTARGWKKVSTTEFKENLNKEDAMEILNAIDLLNDNSEVDASDETTFDDSDEDISVGSSGGEKWRDDEQVAENFNVKIEKPSAEERSDNAPAWTLSYHSVRDPASLPGRILSPFLFNKTYADEFSRDGVKILYNDQTPTKTTVAFGHSKGLVLGNSDGGVWIVHSVPHFVDDAQDDYSYPHTGLMYGQNFLCLSLNRTELNEIGNNLGHNQVFKYSTQISDANRALYPTLSAVIDGTYATSGQNYYQGQIHTRFASIPFRTFAKTRELGQDLYANMARDLSASLLVETWPNGPGRLHSDCQQAGRLVENVQGINASVVAFASTHDHAKWTISFHSGAKAEIGGVDGTSGVEKFGDGTDKVSEQGKNESSIDVENIGSNPEVLVEEILHGEPTDPAEDDANQAYNELNPLPYALPESDEWNTESSDAEEGASPDYSSMGEMEAIAHRLMNRRYDLDGNMNNLDTMEDGGKPCAENAQGLLPVAESMEDLAARIRKPHVDRRKRFASQVKAANGGDLELKDELHALPATHSTRMNARGVANAASVDENVEHFVCNGDINRAEDQLKRGGGSVCIDNEVLWGLYHSLISAVEPCSP